MPRSIGWQTVEVETHWQGDHFSSRWFNSLQEEMEEPEEHIEA